MSSDDPAAPATLARAADAPSHAALPTRATTPISAPRSTSSQSTAPPALAVSPPQPSIALDATPVLADNAPQAHLRSPTKPRMPDDATATSAPVHERESVLKPTDEAIGGAVKPHARVDPALSAHDTVHNVEGHPDETRPVDRPLADLGWCGGSSCGQSDRAGISRRTASSSLWSARSTMRRSGSSRVASTSRSCM